MSHPTELNRVCAEIASHFCQLSHPMQYVLSLYVFGIVVVRHCGQTQVATFLGKLLDDKPQQLKQRLRELTYEKAAKRGSKRQELEVSSCFAPLLKWVLSKFMSPDKQVVLALDATYLGDRFVILAVSVVISGTAIPVAWHIQAGDQKGAWNPIWLALLAHLAPAIGPEWTVFVLTDSGLYTKTLYEALAERPQWHVLMRIESHQGLFKRPNGAWIPLRQLVWRGMKPRAFQGTCFKNQSVHGTVMMQWEAAYEKPCLILTDLPPNQINPNLYAIRYWIECGFKDLKRGLFHWEHTKMTCPQRVERLWLVLAIALFWLTLLGDADYHSHVWLTSAKPRRLAHSLSAPVLGWIQLIVKLIQGQPAHIGSLTPYPWLPIPDP